MCTPTTITTNTAVYEFNLFFKQSSAWQMVEVSKFNPLVLHVAGIIVGIAWLTTLCAWIYTQASKIRELSIKITMRFIEIYIEMIGIC